MLIRIRPNTGPWVCGSLRPLETERRFDLVEAPRLPLDLTTWVDESFLVVCIETEVLGLDWNNSLVVEHLKRHPDYHPKTMLSLLCIGYSTEVFSSHEIQSRCHSHPAFALLCDGWVPFADELTRFRRKNRLLIVEVLARVFRTIWQARSVPGAVSEAREKELRDIALARLDIARHMDSCD